MSQENNVATLPMTAEQMQAEIARLTAENAKLVAKANAPQLNIVSQYNTDELVSLEDTEALQPQVTTVNNLSKADLQALVRLSGLQPQAQHRAEGKKGRGHLLYDAEEVRSALFAIGAC